MCWRPASVIVSVVCFALGCQPPGPNDPTHATANDGLPGVDTNSLTRAEREIWAELVHEQLAPCPALTQSIAECVRQSAPCNACLPAAEQMAQQIRRGKTKSQVEKAFRARFTDSGLTRVDIEGSPSKGPADAPITIVEWADYQCPFCAKAVSLLEELETAYPNRIRFIFKHFPLDMHVHAAQMSKIAIAAGNQGKYWEMHRLLFAADPNQLDEAGIRKLAAQLQLDADKLLADMQAPETAERIQRDRSQGDKAGLKGTPFLVINSRRFDFAFFDLEEDLRTWIDVELRLISRAQP